MNRYLTWLILGCMLVATAGCNKFLEEKSKTSLAIPKTVKDLQALMDYELYTIRSFPVGMDVAADYYFMNDNDVKSLGSELSDIYLLNNKETKLSDWSESYKKIMYANIVLDNIDRAALDGLTVADKNLTKGTALFHRSWNFFWLVQQFSPAYDGGTAKLELGIPLRNTSDINVSFQRATLEQTFVQIISDLKEAISLLPDLPLKKTRPSKAAVYALLARTLLYMGNLDEALKYATLCLQIQPDLINYNLIPPNAATPFELMNSEVIFHCSLAASDKIFGGTKSYVDTLLFESYPEGDLRKSLYFKKSTNGFFNFKGSYGGPTGTAEFAGLATDEIYLIKAECEARSNKLLDANNTMTDLLKVRFESGKLPIIPKDKSGLTNFILGEREKELAFRFGIRWADIKRLNKLYDAGISIKRIVDGKEYVLEPNDKRFAMWIPPTIIVEGDLLQNP
ncbi:RagB/SusD family nutrient uptake outer membrane protein [Sphingobacterium sp. CZ-UAM]|uniref:RagB/SusD family nutrient uptake outer membrane protein n=1 Tax=Sphingobacterium sp. CZ-UAM TaxID=1933868 RepID=UPI0009847EEF|nr:RagB/SusD family nutrient uptake outer membrane protein [Sphingobacterium sp. CZ-UAM]